MLNPLRCAKGALTGLAATAACHTLMTAGYRWAGESEDPQDTFGTGVVEFLLATAVSWALMPLLLWAGMRLLGETGNLALVLAAGVTWVFLSGYFIDDMDRPGGHMPYAALLAHVLWATALSGVSTRTARDGT
ncbi:hypothetical protein ACFV0R_16700 [Streptomyces sp. NPDC059578]|uniref:hypothetical protein n=1 Tax=Streptomyces sp. NPDC059578 TaxID=3346874 RepID=UPI0036C87653